MDLFLWVLAIILSVGVAHFYYRRTGKSLSFYLLLDDQPLSRIDQNVRDRLSISFSHPEAPSDLGKVSASLSSTVDDLHHIQVIIYNNGVRAVTFTESPAIDIPNIANILDATVIYQKPVDLGATVARLPVVDGKDQTVRIAVRMLNRGEFLVIKFLLSKAIVAKDLKLHLLAEDLDRNIGIKSIPPDATKSKFEATDISAIVVGVLCMLSAAATANLATEMLSKVPLPGFSEYGFFSFLQHLSMMNYTSIVSFLSVILLGVFGAALLFGIGMQPFFLKDRVVLPKDIRPRN